MKKKDEDLSLSLFPQERENWVKMFTRALSPFLIKNLFVEVSSAMLGKRERKNESVLSLSLRARVCVCVCVCLNALVCLFHAPILMRKIICEDEKKQIFGRERQDRKSAHEEYQT